MKRFHSLLLTALCLLSACEPPPSSIGGGLFKAGSLRVDALKGNNTSFPDQKVCGSSAEQLITVYNEEASARQISFAEASEPFVLTAIQDDSGRRSLPFAPFTLNPTKGVSFVVKFSPRMPADFTGYLHVYSDASSSPLKIPLSGKGMGPRLELSPSWLTLSLPAATSDAGVSDNGGTSLSSFATGTVHLTNSGNAPLTSVSLGPVASPFSAQLSRPVTTSEPLKTGDTVDLVVTFNPITTEPISTDTLFVASDDPCAPASRIPLTGFRTAGSTTVVAPTALTFAEQEVGTLSAPQTVKVLNGGGSVLTIDSISIQGDSDAKTQFIVSPSGAFSLAPGGSRDLSVKFSPTAAGHPQATLQLASSNSSGGGSFPAISLSGHAVQAASLEIGATSIEFSTQLPGESQWQEVSVKNPGSKKVTVTAAVASTDAPNAFTVNPGQFTLEATASLTLRVSLMPPSTAVSGPLLGQLTLLTSEASGASRQTLIPLHGKVERTRVVPLATDITFPKEQLVGDPPQTQALILQNPTSLPVTVHEVAAGSLGPYSVTGLPVTIPANETRSVTISFNPSSRKQWDIPLQLNSNAVEKIASVKLSGKAIAPELSVSSSLDLTFGTKAPDTETPKTVTVKNTGDSLLKINNIVLSNTTDFKVQGLTSPRYVAAGDSSSFDVIFNPRSLGYKEATLQFYVGESSTLLTLPQIKLSGTSSGPLVSFSPSAKVDFGYRRFNETAVMNVRITNDESASETLQLESASLVVTKHGFELGGPYTDLQAKPGEYIDIQVKFTPTVVDASYSDTLTLVYKGTTTNVSRTKRIELQGWGATALLKVVSALPFGAVGLNQGSTQKLILTNEGKSNLKLSSISGLTETRFSIGNLGWPKEIAPGAKEEIPITFSPTTLDAVTANLVITSNATDRNAPSKTTTTTEVLLSGRGAAPRATFPPAHLGFGNVPIGQTGTATLRITNEGTAELCFTKPNPSPHFQVLNPGKDWPLCIPGQGGAEGTNSFDFKFEFKPDSEAPVSESITLASNDAGKPGPITLEGIGTKPKLSVPSSINFGRAIPVDGGTGFHEIEGFLPVQNAGKAPLIIKTLSVERPFCVVLPSVGSCVQETPSGFEFPVDGPGPKTFTLRVKPTSEKISRKITITTNEGAADSAIKEVALLVGTDGVFIQSEPLDFGTCAMDGSPTNKSEKSINVWNTAGRQDAITQVSFGGPDGLDFEAVNAPSSPSAPSLPVPAGGLATLNLRFKPRNGAAGLRTATARIYTADRGSSMPLVLNLKGVATGSFSGFKDFQWEVDFGTQRLRETKEPVRFPLENQIDRPIFVKGYALEGTFKDDFTVEPDELSCRIDPVSRELEIRTGERCYLKLSYVAKDARESSAALVLDVWTREGDTRVPATRVTLVGKMVPSILAVEPGAVDFGGVDLGQSIEPRLLTVTNTSRVETRGLIPEVSHPEVFSVEVLEPDKDIPPGGSTQLLVTFRPTEGGEVTGKLQLRLQGEQDPDVTIDLHGQVREVIPEGGGCSSGASEGGPLLAGGLLLMALGVRRRSRQAAP